MSIRPLPEHVVERLKSSVVVTSLNGVVCGLLANALDAGASKANLSVDYTRGNCTVEDNGSGIPPQEFQVDGGLGKLHHTSRFPPSPSNHGKHGNFLASLAALSLLSITSRHHEHVAHNSLVVHHSKVLARRLPSSSEQRLVNVDHGTRVIVRDLFGCMPVRVKQRAVFSERSSIDKEWTKLVQDVVALLLAWPTGINVSLRDTATRRELRFRPSEKTDIISRTSRLLIQAALADSSHANEWVPVSASSGSLKVKGCICESPVASRRSQFLSFDIHPISNDYGKNVLYEEINKIFGNSSFGMQDGTDTKDRDSLRLEDVTGKELRSRKSIERWPMFYFKISLDLTDAFAMDDVLDNRGKELEAIIDLLKAVCYGFLKKHHFRPRKVRLALKESGFSASQRLGRPCSKSTTQPEPDIGNVRIRSSHPSVTDVPSLRPQSPFDGWHRVKVGQATPLDSSQKLLDIRTKQSPATSAEPLVGEGGRLLRKPFDEPLPEPEAEAPENQSQDSASPEPNSYQTEASEDGHSTGHGQEAAEQADVPPTKRRRLDFKPKSQPSQWLQDVVRAWDNPVFETAQTSIPRLDDSPAAAACKHGTSHHWGRAVPESVAFESASMNLVGRISRQALCDATVVSQVDKKFILAKLPLNNVGSKHQGQKSSSALVMLDQHAVDERCRLEDLMAGYFTGDPGLMRAHVETLQKPIAFDVSPKERDLLKQYCDHFSTWGIIFRVHQRPRITVTALPPSILERCRLEPRLIIDMLRKESWRIVDEGLPTRARPSDNQMVKPWISHFHGCPQGILDMLYSRACRSAIMFNDVLSKEDCETLLARLAKCAFPFQCAHGRPSMAPLVDLGEGGKFGSWKEQRTEKVSLAQWIQRES